MSYSTHLQRCKRSFIKWSYETGQQCYQTLFSGESEEEIDVTQEIFWNEYTDFDNNID